MSRIYLKKAQLTAKSNASEVHETVKNILTDIEAGGDSKAKEYASKFDKYQGNIILIDELHTCDSSRFWIKETYKHRLNKNAITDIANTVLIKDVVIDSDQNYKINN